MRIDSNGTYQYCRWIDRNNNFFKNAEHNISRTNVPEYFQKKLSSLRTKMLNGEEIRGCSTCIQMEEQGKISGRQKQLLKTGIQLTEFEETFQSSTFLEEFKKSSENNGDTELLPQDWQIDLGNFCNSACIFCSPNNSSKLAAEYKKLGLISQLPKKNWADDPTVLENFVKLLVSSKKLVYLHFLGGETIITPAFKKILKRLIEVGINKNITIGFTTNLTVWDQEITDLLIQYQKVNLGMSIECLHPVNDYLRWPSKIIDVKKLLEKWLKVAAKNQWLIQLRTTPTVFSIGHLKELYKYAFEKNIGIESCNFLHNPSFMKISLLPAEIRKTISKELLGWVESHKEHYNDNDEKIINTRSKNTLKKYILQDAISYVNYLNNVPDETHLWPKLVEHIKKLESSRGNNILDYAPEYEKLLRSAGY
jgi:sulfatase maturation enzyme AslB (radical SAM superfamily)